MLTRRVAVSFATVVLCGMTFAGASPAHAATASPGTISLDCSASVAGANDATVTGAVGDTFTFNVTSSGWFCYVAANSGTWLATNYFTGYSGTVTMTGLTNQGNFETFTGSVTATIVASGSFTLRTNNSNTASTITVVATSPPSGDPGETASTPESHTVTFQEPQGATCATPKDAGGTWSGLADTAISTTWVRVPTCARAGVEFLGWATNEGFPVEIAHRQVANDWGAWDGDVDGVRMIFIPLYGWTNVTGDNTLYPIWG